MIKIQLNNKQSFYSLDIYNFKKNRNNYEDNITIYLTKHSNMCLKWNFLNNHKGLISLLWS